MRRIILLFLLLALCSAAVSATDVTTWSDGNVSFNMTAPVLKNITVQQGVTVLSANFTITPMGNYVLNMRNDSTYAPQFTTDCADGFTDSATLYDLAGIATYNQKCPSQNNRAYTYTFYYSPPNNVYNMTFSVYRDSTCTINTVTLPQTCIKPITTIYITAFQGFQFHDSYQNLYCNDSTGSYIQLDSYSPANNYAYAVCDINMTYSYQNSTGISVRVNNTVVYSNSGNLTYPTTINLNANNTVQNWLVNNSQIPVFINGSHIDIININNLDVKYTSLGLCQVGDPNPVSYNFTMRDESNFTQLFGNFFADLVYQGYNLSFQANNVSSIALCIGANQNYLISGRVQAVSATTTNYYLINAPFNNVTQNVNIYGFFSSTGLSTLAWTLKDNQYNLFPGIIGKMYRYYPANHTYYVVQMDSSDEFGRLYYNIIEQTTEYKLEFYNSTDGTLITSTDVMKFLCTSGVCSVNFIIGSLTPTSTPLSVNMTFENSTHIITTVWNDITGGTSSVNVHVAKQTMSGDLVICDSTTFSPAGSVTCNVTGYNGVFAVTVFSSRSPTPAFTGFVTVLGARLESIVGVNESEFLAFVLDITIAMLGIVSPVATIIMAIVGLWVIAGLGISSGFTYAMLIVATCIGIAIAMKVKR